MAYYKPKAKVDVATEGTWQCVCYVKEEVENYLCRIFKGIYLLLLYLLCQTFKSCLPLVGLFSFLELVPRCAEL